MTDRVKSLFRPSLVTPILVLTLVGLFSTNSSDQRSLSDKPSVSQEVIGTMTPPKLFPVAGERLTPLGTVTRCPIPSVSTPAESRAVLTSTTVEVAPRILAQPDVADHRELKRPSLPILNQPSTLKTASQPTAPEILPSEAPYKTSLLKPESERLTQRSIQLERIARKADAHIRYGFELASRNANFCARSEFIKALRVVAQGLDVEHGTRKHSRALVVGLTAVKEAEDFLPKGTQLEANLNLDAIVGSHCTPILKDTDVTSLTALESMRAYFTFAQEQLGTAVQPEIAGSMALHGLGKLHASMAQNHEDLTIRATEAKAMAFFQASLVANPRNELSANDLGVLLAKCGRYENAKAMLEHSLLCHEKPSTWRNLAVVYHHLNKNKSARLALQKSRISGTDRQAIAKKASTPAVQWVTPDAFAQTHTRSPNAPRPTTVPKQTERSEKHQASRWSPWSSFEKRK